ncbi:unnamed protein product [Oppiella nova]|uniref:Uncharacterized protein n=1 Tax=Oppiella nova TaxID=334625 RepID=A0A7R9LNE3_9ACAR|nr:unnamed protein product [Oppiella nova]CAG2164688.1 unnamed protein product [Oppiella nova]
MSALYRPNRPYTRLQASPRTVVGNVTNEQANSLAKLMRLVSHHFQTHLVINMKEVFSIRREPGSNPTILKIRDRLVNGYSLNKNPRYQRERGFLDKIIAIDETWLKSYDPQDPRQTSEWLLPEQKPWEELDHPSYSPDMSPPDMDGIQRIKAPNKGKQFHSR